MIGKIKFLQSAFVLLCLTAFSACTFAQEPPVFTGRGDFAIRGYDAVAYHKQEKPVKGNSHYTAQWNGAMWRFANAENRDQFQEDPEKWAPKYGGYCAWAVSNNYTASTDPDAWSIVDGKLYLNYSRSIRKKWGANTSANIARGDANWPGVLSK